MNFRKGIFALAAAGLGLTGIANAQISCTTAAPTPATAFVRAEGTTELVPNITLSSCTQGTTTPTSVSVTVTSNAGIANTLANGSTTNSDATATFFGGAPAVQGVVSGNSITFTASGASLGTGYATGIVISNLRVNASSIPVNTNVTATATGTNGLILTNASNVVIAYTQPGMAKPVVQGYKNTAICSAGTAVIPILEAAITSNYPGSFTPEGSALFGGAAPDIFVAVTFGGLASGANYYVPAVISGAGNVLNINSATYESSNTLPAATAQTGTTIGPSGGAQVTGVVQLTVNNGSATALYHLALAAPPAGGTQGFMVPLYAVTTSGATVGVTSSPTVTASFMGPSTGYDQFASNQNQTAVSAATSPTAVSGFPFPSVSIGGTAATTGGGQLTSCATTLLFPYVVNVAGYDTGIAITNVSSGSTSQNGTCSVTFSGSGAPTAAYTTATINAGTVGAFTISSTAPGLQGYAIASCNFQNAHGFAFITDGFGGGGRGLSEGYLAIITSEGGSTITSSPF
jgi:hypothetical protein